MSGRPRCGAASRAHQLASREPGWARGAAELPTAIGAWWPRYPVRAAPPAAFLRLICRATPVELTRHRANCSLNPVGLRDGRDRQAPGLGGDEKRPRQQERGAEVIRGGGRIDLRPGLDQGLLHGGHDDPDSVHGGSFDSDNGWRPPRPARQR
jgi:hypothetical protein